MQYWVEKTYVKSRPDRQQGEFAFGSVLWSPQSGSDGRDTYRLMRDVKPGDVVFHFIDKNAISGVSIVAEACNSNFVGPKGTEWQGRPAYLVRLRNYTKLTPPIGRSEFLDEAKYKATLLEIAKTHDSLFFDRNLTLRQGAYLTIAPPKLVSIWNEIYFSKTNNHLPLLDANLFPVKKEAPPLALAESAPLGHWIFQGNPEHFDINTYLKNRTEITWTVRQRKNQITEGDKVLLWKSGPDGGVVAHCVIIAKPSESISDDAPELWSSGKGKQGGELRCKLRVLHEYVASPISRDTIRGVLPDLGILKFPNATNFRIDQREYDTILSLPKNNVMPAEDSQEFASEARDAKLAPKCQYWTFSPGEDAERWEEFYQKGLMAIGWDEMGDLRLFKSKEDIRLKLQELWPNNSDKKNDAHACWQFVHDIAPGDVIIAKQGSTKLLGFGRVEDIYEFDNARPHYKHVRKVKWHAKGEWDMPVGSKMAIKTLTDITQDADFVTLIASKVGLQLNAVGGFLNSASGLSKGDFDDTYIAPQADIEHYDKIKAMNGLFLAETQFDEMLDALKEKKNVVLQGAPGVGKTFVAKRLAYALNETNDQRQVEMIQFHQSYSYEDFIQGFRPTSSGHFDLQFGIFYQFCRRAQRNEAAKMPYVFIIDEINRGNLSKIFGELMMLIEPDKRGKEHAIPLAYSQDTGERFYIPENLHLIGMMNTADRSLAMVDYALRRRFRFITLRPEFSSPVFGTFLGAAGATPELIKKIVSRMNALNEVIAADTKNLGPGYQIGHSYFCPRNGMMPSEDWYRRVIESEIVPLIQEYWFDNEQKVKEQRSSLLA